ncbi:MAG TPA: FKBP-type peptidyl-prolyl cis-trans isomerase [Marmoricola sp.]|nr:FKBP-type peptidyl-prolyl cis-trans isomerase [Marmoricola sp.]
MLVRRSLTALAALVLLSTAACGSDGEDASSSADALDGLQVSGEFGEKPEIKIDGLDVEKVQSAELIEGDGAEVTKDSYVDYRFSIVNINGDEVASNYQENAPTELVVAEQPESIIDAVVGTHIGSRVAIAIPVKDLVGEQGAPQAGLEPDDDMVLVFDMLEEVEPPLEGPEGDEVDPPADAPKVLGGEDGVTGLDFSDAPAKAPKKLQVIPLIEGDGPEVKQGDNVTVDYYGAVWGAEEPFDESYSRTPATFPLTPGGLIEGWVQGLEGVKVGSRVMLVIPPELGYGAEGSGEKIPGNSTLVFVIDVLGA